MATQRKMTTVTPRKQEAAGSRRSTCTQPAMRRARRLVPAISVSRGPDDEVCLGEDPESGRLWGASTFARESDLETRGKVWMLPAGSVVPPDLAVIPDGADYGGPAPTSHHSIVPTRPMSFAEFETKYLGLGWINTGRKRD